ncbi:MAG: hypothetical protein KDK12_09625 [Rhodobacteraceae bacterium]|nr:hypothetical protein [Paracoccaceae bacterium]
MKPLITAGLLAGAALVAAGAQAQESLVFGMSDAEHHPLNERVITPWINAINADNPGALQIEMRYGPTLVSPQNYYDRLIDDVVQVVWGMTVFDPGRFPRALVSTLPFMVPSAEAGSAALCAMYGDGAFGDEMAEIVPLLFVEFPQASLSLNGHAATSLEAMAGLKVMTGSPATAGIIQAYGGTPLSIQLPDQYEALQRGTAEGTIMNFTAFPGFHLGEVTTDHFVFPGGGALGMVFMTRESYDGLSDDARAVLDRHRGCDSSRAAGAAVDGWEAGARAMVEGMPGHTVTDATPEQIAELQARVGPGLIAGYSARVPGGEALIAQFGAALAAAAAE